MLDKLLRLGKETAIYGLSTILGRLLNFLIVPLYANVLLPTENGVIANLYAYIAFAFVVFCYGLESAYMRFVVGEDTETKRSVFSNSFLLLVLTSGLLGLFIQFSAAEISLLIGMTIDESPLVQYAGWILCLDALAAVPFAALRMERKAAMFASVKILNIISTIALNVFLIVGVGMRTEGVFLANLIASGLTFIVVFFLLRKELKLTFDRSMLGALLRFGLPTVPAGLAGMAMQVVDRPIVKALTDDATLGVYQLNYRLGIFMMLIVGMFDFAWRPFFLNHAKEPDAKPLFARVFTIVSILMLTVFLLVSLFVEDAVRITLFGKQFFPPLYWEGTGIVPWVLLSYVFLGSYVIFVVGLYLEKKTQYLPLVSGIGALLKIAMTFLLVPLAGIAGAAAATVVSYAVMAVGMYFMSQRFYPVSYEWGRVARSVAAAALIFLAFRLIDPLPLSTSGLLIKTFLLVLFVVSLFLLRVVRWTEISTIVRRFSPV